MGILDNSGHFVQFWAILGRSGQIWAIWAIVGKFWKKVFSGTPCIKMWKTAVLETWGAPLYSLVLNPIWLCCVKKAIYVFDRLLIVLSNHLRSITLSRFLEPWLFKILVAPTTFHQHFYHYILLSPTLLHLHSAFTNTFTLTVCFHQHVYTYSLLCKTSS